MSRLPNARMRKVNEAVREIVAAEVTGLKDPGLGFVTITGVDTAPDLRTARVFYSVLVEEDAQATAGALGRAAPRLQAAVAAGVKMKYTPRLRFLVDPSIEQGVRIERILQEIEEERRTSEGGT